MRSISDRNVGGGIHVETGIWANVQATTNPQEVATVAPDALAAEIDATFWIDPFANYRGLDFRLKVGTAAGATLTEPFNVDATGLIRGLDGVWDRGAFEFTAPSR